MPESRPSPLISATLPAVVLAGGLSRRMGSPKSDLQLGGRTMLSRIVARLRPQVGNIAVNLNAEPAVGIDGSIPVITDTVPGFLGPLAGVLTAMRHVAATTPDASHVVVVPTDTPFFPDDLLARLAHHIVDENTIVIAASNWSTNDISCRPT